MGRKPHAFEVRSAKSLQGRDPFAPAASSLVCPQQKGPTMSDQPVVLINLLKVEPAKQEALIALLKQNTDTVITTLAGWKSTRLIAAADGASVIIYSEWETPAAAEAMRNDPRMQAYFPEILALASVDSIVGAVVSSTSRSGSIRDQAFVTK